MELSTIADRLLRKLLFTDDVALLLLLLLCVGKLLLLRIFISIDDSTASVIVSMSVVGSSIARSEVIGDLDRR